MIFLLFILSASPAAALLCRHQAPDFPFVGIVLMQPNSHVALECSGASTISVSTQHGKLEVTSRSKNTLRFNYFSPALPSSYLASGVQVVCEAAKSAKCFFFIDFDFPLQILDKNREIEVAANSEVNISNPFLVPARNHRYSFRVSTPDTQSNWTNTIKPLRLVVRNDTRVNFEVQDTVENKTFLVVTNLKTRKPHRPSSPPPTIRPAAIPPLSYDYRELAQLMALLLIYFLIICLTELLKFFSNKD